MVDYSKFDKLDFSSDEDDCHPNIEINTWRRLKERMREEKGIKKREPEIKDKWNTTSVNAKKTKSPPPSDSAPGDTNTDNPSSINDNKPATVITSSAPSSTSVSSTTQGVENKNTIDDIKTNVNDKPITKEKEKEKEIDILEDIEYYSDPTKFLEQNLNKIKKYGKIKTDLDAIKYLNDNSYLIHEAAEGYLITLAVDLAVEDKMDDSRLTAKRCLEIHNLIKACKSANLKPDKGIELYYKRLSIPAMKAEYLKEFELQFKELWNRIETRKIERLNELNNNDNNNNNNNEYSNEDLAPLGPGGLDPSQVLNSLPKVLQDAFISKDIDHLKYALTQLTPEEASYYMKQCIDSGLWVPGPEDQNADLNNNGDDDDDDVNDDENDDVNDDENDNDDNGADRGSDNNNNDNNNNNNNNNNDNNNNDD